MRSDGRQTPSAFEDAWNCGDRRPPQADPALPTPDQQQGRANGTVKVPPSRACEGPGPTTTQQPTCFPRGWNGAHARCDGVEQAHPDDHRDLIVPVAGYSDHFCDLSPSLQNEIISRTEHPGI